MNGWLITVAGCYVNILILGTARLAPLLFVASLDRYNAERKDASFPFVLCYLVRTISGPLIGYLGAKIGLRAVTVLGCFVSAIGIGACFFAEDIFAIAILWGGIYGLGIGLGSALLPSIVSLYFKENLTKANAIVYVGSSIGGIILPPVVDVILDTYGLSGTFLILSAIVLNGIPAAMFLKTPDCGKKNISKSNDIVINTNPEPIIDPKFETENFNQRRYVPSIRSSLGQDRIGKTDTFGCTNKAFVMNEAHNHGTSKAINKNSSTISNLKHPSVFQVTPGTPELLQLRITDAHSNLCFNQKNSLNLEDLRRKNELQNSPEDARGHTSRFGSLHIFCDLVFLLIALVQSTFTFAVTIVWTIITDYVRDKGIERSKQTYFLICLPVSDTIGRLALGFVVDGGYMSQTNYCVLCFFLMGAASCLMVWATDFLLMMIAVFVFSLITGGIVITFPVMIIDFMRVEERTMAMASRMFLYSPFCLSVTPLIGFFRGTLGSYDDVIYIVSLFCMLGCVMVYAIPHLARNRDKKQLMGTH